MILKRNFENLCGGKGYGNGEYSDFLSTGKTLKHVLRSEGPGKKIFPKETFETIMLGKG